MFPGVKDGHLVASMAVAPECKPKTLSGAQLRTVFSSMAEGPACGDGRTHDTPACMLYLMAEVSLLKLKGHYVFPFGS